jgi:hypothetical protein
MDITIEIAAEVLTKVALEVTIEAITGQED